MLTCISKLTFFFIPFSQTKLVKLSFKLSSDSRLADCGISELICSCLTYFSEKQGHGYVTCYLPSYFLQIFILKPSDPLIKMPFQDTIELSEANLEKAKSVSGVNQTVSKITMKCSGIDMSVKTASRPRQMWNLTWNFWGVNNWISSIITILFNNHQTCPGWNFLERSHYLARSCSKKLILNKKEFFVWNPF